MAIAAYTKSCTDYDNGGVKNIYVIDRADLTSMTLGTGSTNVYGTITLATSKTWFEYEFKQDSAMFKEDVTMPNGSAKAEHRLEFYLEGIRATTSDAIQDLIDASSCGMIVVVELNNGQKVVMGYNESFTDKSRPAKIETDATDSGKLLDDANGSVITILSSSDKKAFYTTAAITVA